MPTSAAAKYDSKTRRLICRGDWNLANLPYLKNQLHQCNWPKQGEVVFDGQAITKMDSAAAWLLEEQRKQLLQQHIKIHFENFSKASLELLDLIAKETKTDLKLPPRKEPNTLTKIGLLTVQQLQEGRDFLAFIGQLFFDLLRLISTPKRWRFSSLTSVIYLNGYLALPIIALLSFLIGVVLTYQMGLQLRNYGANIYIVDLLGLSVLREFGPLLTAIMVAGRTGSAFTAQLGMMKLNQEIDALNTMGVTPGELLLIPRIIGMFITLPLLSMWADIFGVFGGMVMANNMLNISWYDFLHRFPHVVPLRSFLIGIGKAPIFALIISSVGCFEGMKVGNSAESVGRNTTRSVVLSIFFIIVADAIFSIIFSKLKL